MAASEDIKKLLKIEKSVKKLTSIEEGGIKITFYEWRLPNGDLHREFGPAIECEEFKSWHLYGKDHREDGPAYTKITSEEVYYNFHGHYIRDYIHLKECVESKNKAKDENKTSFIISNEEGNLIYLNFKGEVHNEHGPAITRSGEADEYWLNDVELENKDDWIKELKERKMIGD
jgi:hypothetical protein